MSPLPENWKSSESMEETVPEPVPGMSGPARGNQSQSPPQGEETTVPPSQVSAVLAERLNRLQMQAGEDRRKALSLALKEALGEEYLSMPAQIQTQLQALYDLLITERMAREQVITATATHADANRRILEQAAKDVRDLKARPLPKPTSRLPWVLTMVALLTLIGAVVMWHRSIRSALAAIPMVTIESAEQRATAREELARLSAQVEARRSEINALETELASRRAETVEATSTLQTTLQARTQAQLELGSMETLKQRHRSSLMPGQNGKLYAEVVENPAPFLYAGRWYVEVKESNSPAPKVTQP